MCGPTTYDTDCVLFFSLAFMHYVWFPLFLWHACNLTKFSTCIAKCMTWSFMIPIRKKRLMEKAGWKGDFVTKKRQPEHHLPNKDEQILALK